MFGATRAGSNPPGSRVTDRSNRGVPNRPSSSSAARRGPVRSEAAVESDLQHHAGRARSVDGPVGIGQREGHRLLAEHRLARGGGGHHQVGVEAGRRGDDDRVDLRVGEDICRDR